MGPLDKFGTAIGNAIGAVLDPILGARVRAHYAKVYGTCRACQRPLGGPSPDHVCEECHAREIGERADAKAKARPAMGTIRFPVDG